MRIVFSILGFAVVAIFILPNFISRQESLAIFVGATMGYLLRKFQTSKTNQPQG